MIKVPMWLTLSVASMVVIFGLYRIRLAFRSAEAEQQARKRKGLYSLPRRTHALIGILYLVLGGYLAAMAFGFDVTRLFR
jgi:cadmium resistance protein CadD (predicted permease)